MAITLRTSMDSATELLTAWDAWNQPYITSGTGGTVACWSEWNNQWTTSASTTVTYRLQTWQNWAAPVQVYSMGDLADSRHLAAAATRARHELRTEDEWNDIRARNEARRIDRDNDAVSVAARAEAHKLLAMILTPAQMASYAANRHFDVVGSAGGVYRIHHGTSGNIRRLHDGTEVNRLCVHPQLWTPGQEGYLPTEDCLAAQALALMHDEIGAVSRANVHQGQRHLAAVA